MSEVPDSLRSEYFFDLNLMEHAQLFEGISCVYEVVKKMQEGGAVDDIVRKRCDAVVHSG